MSAIGGYWSFQGQGEQEARCRAVLDAQAEYGPDADACALIGSFALGRRLFRLLPEDRYDRQPLVSNDGRFGLVADVRLDNRKELQAACGRSAADGSALADSDLLFLALQKWREDALERIDGDFAFAFFDARESRLLLARDPLGQRPLFWHRGDGFVAFASMPKGLHALPSLDPRPDLETVARFVALLPDANSRSWFERIERVGPGHMVSLRPDGAQARRYWTPRRRDLGLRSDEDYIEAFRAELDRAVACRLRGAENLVASHLSGGWDSSAVTATAARLMAPTGGRVLALTSIPRLRAEARAPAGRFADESSLAAATASLYPNLDHRLLEAPACSAVTGLERYRGLFERPLFNLCNHVWLGPIRAAAAAGGARILLTGEIGNWTISAAPNALLADFVRAGRWSQWWREAGGMLRDRRASLRGVLANSFGPWVPAPLWRLAGGISSGPGIREMSPANPQLEDLLREREELERTLRRKDYVRNATDAITDMDFGELRKGILGGWGVDKRDATADPRLIEFCLSLPLEKLLSRGVRRPLARAALSDRLPAAVLEERRKGYQGADWATDLTNDLSSVAALVEAIAQDPAASSVIDADRLRRWTREWPTGNWEDTRTRVRYRIALLHGLSAGHFVLAASRSGSAVGAVPEPAPLASRGQSA